MEPENNHIRNVTAQKHTFAEVSTETFSIKVLTDHRDNSEEDQHRAGFHSGIEVTV